MLQQADLIMMLKQEIADLKSTNTQLDKDCRELQRRLGDSDAAQRQRKQGGGDLSSHSC